MSLQSKALALSVPQGSIDAYVQMINEIPVLSADEEMKHHWDYIYEPEAKDLLDGLLTRYVESQVYQAVVSFLVLVQ